MKLGTIIKPAPAVRQYFFVALSTLRRKHGWKLPDAFQAAVALRVELKLVTRDSRSFDRKKHPFVLIPYKLD